MCAYFDDMIAMLFFMIAMLFLMTAMLFLMTAMLFLMIAMLFCFIFLSENFHFLDVKFSIYLNRRVFVMCIPSANHEVDLSLRYPVSILRKSISGRHRSVRVADGPMTARCRFM